MSNSLHEKLGFPHSTLSGIFIFFHISTMKISYKISSYFSSSKNDISVGKFLNIIKFIFTWLSFIRKLHFVFSQLSLWHKFHILWWYYHSFSSCTNGKFIMFSTRLLHFGVVKEFLFETKYSHKKRHRSIKEYFE